MSGDTVTVDLHWNHGDWFVSDVSTNTSQDSPLTLQIPEDHTWHLSPNSASNIKVPDWGDLSYVNLDSEESQWVEEVIPAIPEDTGIGAETKQSGPLSNFNLEAEVYKKKVSIGEAVFSFISDIPRTDYQYDEEVAGTVHNTDNCCIVYRRHTTTGHKGTDSTVAVTAFYIPYGSNLVRRTSDIVVKGQMCTIAGEMDLRTLFPDLGISCQNMSVDEVHAVIESMGDHIKECEPINAKQDVLLLKLADWRQQLVDISRYKI